MKILIKNREKLSHLMRFCDYNAYEVGRVLSSGMVNVNCDTFTTNLRGFTLLTCAVMTRNFVPGDQVVHVVKQLLDAGADVNKGCRLEMTALHYACIFELPIKVTKLLLDKGADVNKQDCWQRTPLHIAVAHWNRSLIKMLLEAGADPTKPCDEGFTPWSMAKQHGPYDSVKMLNDASHGVLEHLHRLNIRVDTRDVYWRGSPASQPEVFRQVWKH